MKVQITVTKDRLKGYGYNLQHNQPAPFKGMNTTFSWYRFKSDAIKRAEELTKCYN